MALKWKVISQRNWLKGLQATFGRFAQPVGVLRRLSNLLYDKRGALRQTDGSMVFTRPNFGGPLYGPTLELYLYQPKQVNAYYVALQKSLDFQIAPPTGVTVTRLTIGAAINSAVRVGGVTVINCAANHNISLAQNTPTQTFQPGNRSPGNLSISGVTDGSFNVQVALNSIGGLTPTSFAFLQPHLPDSSGTGGLVGTTLGLLGTYTYDVTAGDGVGGETPASGAPGTVTLIGSQNAVKITWTADPSAVGHSVYRLAGAVPGRLNTGSGPGQSITSPSYVDLGNAYQPGAVPPAVNTTQTLVLRALQSPDYAINILGEFPTSLLPVSGGILGATGGSGGSTASSGLGPTANGGVVGSTSPIPVIVEFANQIILALGNGYPPQAFGDIHSGGSGTVAPLGNTFTALYPDWQPSVAFNPGDTIRDSVSGGIFHTTQGGTTGATRPAFDNTLNANTPEGTPGTITWVCIATSFSGTALRGGAHAIVYAGSLWLLNTSPATTDDQLDGPCCIKMSDLNNPSSWNPVNVAFLDRDDGDEITGAATFTIANSGIAPTGSLVIFKYFKTYQLTGVFGAADLTIQQAETELGCVAPRTIQFLTGFGIARLSHLGFAYFNGTVDRLFSEEIRPYLFADPNEPDIIPVDWTFAYFGKAAQSTTPPMYVCALPIMAQVLSGVTVVAGSGGAIYSIFVRVVKLVNGGEVAISGESQVNSGTNAFAVTTPVAAAGVTYRVYAGNSSNGEDLYIEQASFANQLVNLSAMTPGFAPIGLLTRLFCFDLVQKQWAIIDLPFAISALKNIRAPGTVPITAAAGYSDGAVRRMFAGDQLWDTGSQVVWSFTGGELFQDGGTAKVFYRRLALRGRFAQTPNLQIGINLDGGIGTPRTPGTVTQLKAGFWDLRVDILADAESTSATVTGQGPVQMVIETMDWHVKPKPAGVPVSIQK